ncbi:hypothetical protein [Streptomyces canus]|uniref:hypothetical protein n=1 Tax=Streptomyces canus TaxID=58343 RepID=UPI0037121CFC
MTGEQLTARLATTGGPVPVQATTGPQAEALIDELDAARGETDSIAVRYGDHAGLGFAVAYGHWPSVLGPAYYDGTSRDGVHVFELYYEKQNPKVPTLIRLLPRRPLCVRLRHVHVHLVAGDHGSRRRPHPR